MRRVRATVIVTARTDIGVAHSISASNNPSRGVQNERFLVSLSRLGEKCSLYHGNGDSDSKENVQAPNCFKQTIVLASSTTSPYPS